MNQKWSRMKYTYLPDFYEKQKFYSGFTAISERPKSDASTFEFSIQGLVQTSLAFFQKNTY